MRALPISVALAVLLAAAPTAIMLPQAPARAAHNTCYHARPAPKCRSFVLTNSGAYFTPRRENPGSRLSVIVDWGVMRNVSPRQAIGGSWFVSLDNDDFDFTTGPVVRYRRWFESDRSLDVALGTGVAGDLKAGSILGLVKYNPVHWFGVGVRPEYQRREVSNCFPSTCFYTGRFVRVYGGVEFGWIPGLAVSLIGSAAIVGAFAAAAAGS